MGHFQVIDVALVSFFPLVIPSETFCQALGAIDFDAWDKILYPGGRSPLRTFSTTFTFDSWFDPWTSAESSSERCFLLFLFLLLICNTFVGIVLRILISFVELTLGPVT
ncbi:unnamed protein product [Hymenolepis diminuta]|uniref:Secreted protein n=1 Tax=Hymenolepis diminuta TaxID=6216 RepID=A0A0R3S8S3_HYMDI|nr:unnamed protein product [Hymenolepis diminuta]VUZ57171.1 unnamed protein product [Hymenolepis diminuta]